MEKRAGAGAFPLTHFLSEVDFFVQIDGLLRKHAGKHILIALHHLLFTSGSHGGYFSWKDHLFPLTNRYPNIHLPLPVIGSLYEGKGLGKSGAHLIKNGLLHAEKAVFF